MVKKWKPHQSSYEENHESGHDYCRPVSYNAVQYEYSTKRLARPSSDFGKMSPALVRFRENVKKLKAVANGSDSSQTSSSVQETNVVEDHTIKVKKKSKKLKKRKDKENSDSITDKSDSENCKPVIEDCELTLSAPVDTNSDQTGQKKKKKKKKVKTDDTNVDESIKSVSAETVPDASSDSPKKSKKKKKKRDQLEGVDAIAVQNKTREEPMLVCNGDNSTVSDSVDETQKKSKKKKRKIREVEPEECEATTEPASEPAPSKKTKKKKVKATAQTEPEPEAKSEKKRKRKRESRVDEEETSATTTKETGSEESSEGKPKKKKKRKQTEEQEQNSSTLPNSPPTNSTQPDTSVEQGQWSTVSLGDTSRTNKFMKLMGGLRTSFSPQSSVPKKKVATQAMDLEQERKFCQELEAQFVKAKQSVILKGKTAGLGFEKPPGEGKKFYIDTNETKSTKFDD